MALQLKVNGIDRSNHVSWETVQKNEGLTKQPDTLSFEIIKTPSKTMPELGDTVELYEDSVKIFGGIITERSEVIKGGILEGFNYMAKDHVQTLDRLLAVKSYENQTAKQIIDNLITTYAATFTTNNVAASTPTIGSIKFNYEPISKCLEKIANAVGWDWYIDYDKDIHFFQEGDIAAPFNIDDTTGNYEWRTLKFDRNILELKNTIFVRGGEYKVTITESDSVDKYVADGTQRTFLQIYRYSNIKVKKNGVLLTVGIDNITDPASVDVLYNFQEKAIKFRDDNKPANGDTITIYGDAHIPLIAKVSDNTSISTYGEYQHIIVDKTITSVNEAHLLAKAELARWADGSYEGSFKTTKTGLQTGQQITVQSTLRGINKTFKINRITGRARGSNQMEYEVFLLASGQITFTDVMKDLLTKDKKVIEIADDEVLQRLLNDNTSETITIADPTSTTKKSPPYTWGSGGSNDFRWNFFTWA